MSTSSSINHSQQITAADPGSTYHGRCIQEEKYEQARGKRSVGPNRGVIHLRTGGFKLSLTCELLSGLLQLTSPGHYLKK